MILLVARVDGLVHLRVLLMPLEIQVAGARVITLEARHLLLLQRELVVTLLVHKLTGWRQAFLFFARFTSGNYIEFYNVVGHGRLEGVHCALSLNLVQVAHLRVWPVAHD